MERGRNSEHELEEKPFLEHLEDLRWLILRILISWGAASLIAFAFANRVFLLIQWPLSRMLSERGGGTEDFILRSLSPPEVFLVSMKLSLLVGFYCRTAIDPVFCRPFSISCLKRGGEEISGTGFFHRRRAVLLRRVIRVLGGPTFEPAVFLGLYRADGNQTGMDAGVLSFTGGEVIDRVWIGL